MTFGLTSVMLKLIGMWIFCDAWFSICCYLGKEGLKENHIRYIRLVAAVAIMVMG